MSQDSMSDAGDRSVAFVDQARRQEPDVVSSVSFAPQRTHVEQDQMSVGHSQPTQGSRLSFIGIRGAMTRPCPKHDKCVHRLGKGHPGRCLEYDEVTQKRSWIMLDDPGWNEIEHIAPEAAPIVEQPNIMCIDGSNTGVASSSIHNDDESSLNEADVNSEPCPKHDKCIHPQGKGHCGRCTYYDDATHRRTFILSDDPGWKVERKEPSKPKEAVCERPVLRTRPSKARVIENEESGNKSLDDEPMDIEIKEALQRLSNSSGSGYMYVYGPRAHLKKRPYHAQICSTQRDKYKHVNLGYFSTPKEAAIAVAQYLGHIRKPANEPCVDAAPEPSEGQAIPSPQSALNSDLDSLGESLQQMDEHVTAARDELESVTEGLRSDTGGTSARFDTLVQLLQLNQRLTKRAMKIAKKLPTKR